MTTSSPITRVTHSGLQVRLILACLIVGMTCGLMTSPTRGQDADSSPPQFALDQLNGSSLPSGQLKAITRESIQFETSDGEQSVPVRDIEQIRRLESPPVDTQSTPVQLQLHNGSQLGGTSLTVANRVLKFQSSLGELTVPLATARSIRLAPSEVKLATAWSEITARETRNDLLVVRKGDALDFVAGVVSDVTDKDVRLLVRDREVAVPRERVFGIVYTSQSPSGQPFCEVRTRTGDQIRATELTLTDKQLNATLADKAALTIPLSQVTNLDFTLGKVKSLTDLPMEENRQQQSSLLGPSAFKVRHNRTSLGDPLRIGDREFKRGLWIHSGVTAEIRLGREFRRLTAVAGIDSNSPEVPRVAPRLRLKISGDGKELLAREILWNAPAVPLDLDVTGVRVLEIRVDPQGDQAGVLEHLVLGDARVIQ